MPSAVVLAEAAFASMEFAATFAALVAGDTMLLALTPGASTFGESTLGESTLGLSTLGESTLGESTFGLFTFGEFTLGLFTFGESAFGLEAAKADPMGRANASMNMHATNRIFFI